MEILSYTAFTDTPDGGNPAGVVLGADHLSDTEMLRIAADLGHSETAFVDDPDSSSHVHRIRYFSPLAEVDFCGHATIATAVALAEATSPTTVTFLTNPGPVQVSTAAAGAGITATLTSVPTWSEPADGETVQAALDALNWSAADLDPHFPAHVAFAGNRHLILAAGTRSRLTSLHYDFDALAALCRNQAWTTVHLFHREADTVFHARNPFPPGGVVEDPATGAAAAAFGGYLRTVRPTRAGRTVQILQGHDMGRPSLLTVGTDPQDPRIKVSGQAVRIP
ncbi:PhzF family phenazine biosynthesis isomerase [Kitasatospora sp. NPDC048540]|uniref:PhzF family phenazine biosynthesis protein n=1 Tax=unclassified Kitasatospora TaxID=2633591 RepID=UPI000539C8BE|nr:PhzF family phenazine biosynthesis isomerase [Kitasatospora sp. MBT63]